MSERDAFLAAIIADPEDDGPRLVYADWLDEHGDPARAEFIRVQCELAAGPAAGRRAVLEGRERDLLIDHEVEWLGETDDGVREWEFRRGFVGSLAVTARRLGRSRLPMLDAHPVGQLKIAADRPDPSGLTERLGAWPDLGRMADLDLSYHGLEDDHLVRLTDVPRFTPRRLDLSGNRLTFRPLLRRHGLLPELKSLDLAGQPAGEVAAMIVGGHVLPNLERFNLADTGAHASALRPQMRGRGPARFTHLDFGNAELGREPLDWSFPEPRPRLRSLGLHSVGIRSWDLAKLASRSMFPALESLDLSGNPHVLGSISFAASELVRRLVEFDIQGCHFVDHGLPALFSQGRPRPLRKLDLGDNRVPTAGAVLAAAGTLVNLEWLSLWQSWADERAVAELFTDALPSLRSLHLGANGIGEATAHAFVRSPAADRLSLLNLYGARDGDRILAELCGRPPRALTALGLGDVRDLTPAGVRRLAGSPLLRQLTWLDLSGFAGDDEALRPLAESPYLSPLLELDVHGVRLGDAVADRFTRRLGRRFSA